MGKTQSATGTHATSTSTGDDGLASRVCNSFSGLGYRQLDKIQCWADGDHVILDGNIESFYLKQIAQTVAIKVPGVRRVTNNIIVVET